MTKLTPILMSLLLSTFAGAGSLCYYGKCTPALLVAIDDTSRTADVFYAPNSHNGDTTEGDIDTWRSPVSGMISNFRVDVNTAPSAAGSWTPALRVNGVNQITCVIDGTSTTCQDFTTVVFVSPTDAVTFHLNETIDANTTTGTGGQSFTVKFQATE